MAEINPNIILNAVQQQRAGSSPFTNLQHIIQFQDLIEQRKTREAASQKQQTISDLIGKNIQQTPEGVALDQPSFIQQLAEVDPQMALQQQAQVQQQALEEQQRVAAKAKAKADEKKAIADASRSQLEQARDIQGMIGSAAGAVLAAKPENQQAVLDQQLDRLIDQKIITSEMLQSGKIPLNVTPESLGVLRGIQQASLTSKEQLDFALKAREFEGASETEKDKKVAELSKVQFKQSGDLRKEYSKLSGDFIDQKAAFERVQASASSPSAAGDLAMVFNFMKVLDPGSTVREGEFATAAKAAGMPERIIAAALKVDSGKILGPKQRKDFVDRAFKLFDKAKKTQARLRSQFVKIAEKNDLDPEQSVLLFDPVDIMEFGSVEDAEKANLPVGTSILIDGKKAVVE